MQLTVNGVATDVQEGITVADVVANRAGGHRRVAVALNGEVVRRGAWEVTSLAEGDSVEVLIPVAGG